MSQFCRMAGGALNLESFPRENLENIKDLPHFAKPSNRENKQKRTQNNQENCPARETPRKQNNKEMKKSARNPAQTSHLKHPRRHVLNFLPLRECRYKCPQTQGFPRATWDVVWGFPTTPETNTSAKVSRYISTVKSWRKVFKIPRWRLLRRRSTPCDGTSHEYRSSSY